MLYSMGHQQQVRSACGSGLSLSEPLLFTGGFYEPLAFQGEKSGSCHTEQTRAFIFPPLVRQPKRQVSHNVAHFCEHPLMAHFIKPTSR